MAIDTGVRGKGSRIAPTSRRSSSSRAARTYRRTSIGDSSRRVNLSPTLSTSQRIASVGPNRKQKITSALARVMKAYKSSPSAKGLDIPASIARLDVNIGRKSGIPPSVLAAQQRQESGFNPNAVSSAGAFGVSQFIPSTAAEYGVKPGNVKSQVKGQAAYLNNLGFKQDPQKALSGYSGGYSAAAYNNPILQGSKDYKQLDKPGKKPNPGDLKTLQKAGIGVQGGAAKPKPKAAPEVINRFQAIKKAANTLTKGHIPYVWGGGHGGFTTSGGLDCSGAVSAVLHAAGVLNTPLTSGAMGQVLKPGPGAVTVYYNSGHTFMKIGNRYWGTSVGDSGAGGLGNHPAPSGSYLNQYSVGHVPGLGKKAAAGLGIKLTGGGLAVGGGGGTAQLVSNGSIQTTPGFSKNPIKALTSKQKLAKVNALYGSGGSSSPSTGTGSLGSRYGHPAV